jgi:3-deoxy-D-manno-octulosonic-acid transferase
MILLYNIVFFIIVTLGLPLIIPMVLISDKRRKTVFQRLGLTRLPPKFVRKGFKKSKKKRVWVHGLSVGEVLSAVPLIKMLNECSAVSHLVFSASTKTGYDIANRHLTGHVESIFYFPYDFAFSVNRITRKIAPEVVVIVETDIWPNFLHEMKKRRVSVLLVNARLSKASFAGYKHLGFFAKQVFLNFVHICAQSSKDADRFHRLGVSLDRITITGNIKFDEAHQALGLKDIDKLKRSMNIQHAQKVLLAGSTHPGEEEILMKVLTRLKSHTSDLLLIVAPRNPVRSGPIFRMFSSAGFSVGLMKDIKKEFTDKKFDVIIIDTLGLLKTIYAVSDVAFIGGSLVKCGGHNPLEPAAYSKPILFGEDMSDFADISSLLLEAGGAACVRDAEDLYDAMVSLVEDDHKALEMGRNASGVFTANKGAVEKTMQVIETYL